MKHAKFIHSIIAVALSSLAVSGAVFANDSNTTTTRETTTTTQVGNAAAEARADANGNLQRAGQYMDDSAITTKAKSTLMGLDGVKSNDISVMTEDGVVTLTGDIASQTQRERAVTEIKKIDGVKEVNDQLVIAGTDGTNNESQSVRSYFDDSAITGEVKAKYLTADNLPSTDISVETTNGVVRLTGDVETQDQASRAEEIAKMVDGVKSVQNELKVKTK